jgi:hypothetical protein
MEVSNATFPVPQSGSFGVSADMSAQTPGTIAGLTQQGIYGPSGTWTDPANPPTTPNYSATVLEGQQAGVVINLVDFCTGQLFDWFLSAHYAFTLIERLPTNVTGNTTNASCPGAGYVGRDKMYTQIADEIPVTAARITSRSPTRPRRTRSSTAWTARSSPRSATSASHSTSSTSSTQAPIPPLARVRASLARSTRSPSPTACSASWTHFRSSTRRPRTQRLDPRRNRQPRRRRQSTPVRPRRRRHLGQLHRHNHQRPIRVDTFPQPRHWWRGRKPFRPLSQLRLGRRSCVEPLRRSPRGFDPDLGARVRDGRCRIGRSGTTARIMRLSGVSCFGRAYGLWARRPRDFVFH